MTKGEYKPGQRLRGMGSGKIVELAHAKDMPPAAFIKAVVDDTGSVQNACYELRVSSPAIYYWLRKALKAQSEVAK